MNASRRLHRFRRAALLLGALAALPAASRAQEFAANDLYLMSGVAEFGGGERGGIVGIDPLSGVVSPLLLLDSVGTGNGGLCWDPHRKRLLAVGGLLVNARSLHAVAADGSSVELLDDDEGNLRHLTARGDGIVYAYDHTATERFVYIDGANRRHTLMDSTTGLAFAPDGKPAMAVDALHYHAGTNTLVMASRSTVPSTIDATCAGGTNGFLSIRFLPLSADGRTVTGVPACVEYDLDASAEMPAGISHGPGDSVLLGVETGFGTALPRMRRIDPVTQSESVWASNGPYTGANRVSGAAWSTARGEFLILDSFTNVLRGFTLGASGMGDVLTTSLNISSPSSSGETATLIEITDDGCGGAWRAYGVGLAGGGGFVPALTGGGCAEPGGAVSLTIDDTLGGTSGALFAGFTPTALPFKGGTLHVFPFALQLMLGNLGGAAGVPGAGGVTLPVNLPGDPALSGLGVFLQGVFVDGAAPAGLSLSQGLEMRLG